MQLSLSLTQSDPFSASYFVPHSGMADAVEVLEKIVSDLRADNSLYRSVFVYGEPGSGKSHLLSIYKTKLKELGVTVSTADCRELTTTENVRSFVDAVESLKLSGGVMLIEGTSLAACEIQDLAPHVNSRILGGYAVKVSKPSEGELRPLVMALTERRGLRFQEYLIDQLIRNLPAQTTTFNNIIQAIDEVTLREKQRITRGVVSKTLQQFS